MSPVPLGHFIRKRHGSLACNTPGHLGAPPVVTCETVWGCAAELHVKEGLILPLFLVFQEILNALSRT